ncbi:MAG: M20 family metallopeptidase, partial [Candidatus Thorarchaeota archaeon]
MKNNERMLTLTKKLIATNSEDPPGREKEVADILRAHLGEYGIHSTQVGSDERPNLIFSTHGEEFGSLVLHGHMDTVPAGPRELWERDPFGSEMIGDLLYGRGSSDMKGPLAALAETMIVYKEEGHRHPLLFLATSNEEDGCQGAEEVADSGVLNGVDYGVCAEPTSLDLYLGEKGVCWVKVVATGKAGHSSRPDSGVNAIDLCIDALQAIKNGEYPCEYHELMGEYTMNVGVIEGGTQQGVIPDRCEAQIDMRLVKGQTPESVFALMGKYLDEAGLSEQVQLECINESYPTITSRDSRIAGFASDALEAVIGRRPELGVATYGSDSS